MSASPLQPEETYVMLELIETRTKRGSIIFCTQFENDGWYSRIDPDPEFGSPICEAIMARVIHTAYEILVDGLEKAENEDMIFAGRRDLEERYPMPSAFDAYLRAVRV